MICKSGKSVDFPDLLFHGRGRREKQHLQRRFLRKRGACGGRPCSPGGAVAQRLRGFKSAEPKKKVKRSSRRTGVNLQFFSVQPTSSGLKGASSPFFVAPARRNRWHFSGSLLVSKENIPGYRLLPCGANFSAAQKAPAAMRSPGLFGDFGTVCSQSLVIKEECAGFYHRIGLSRSPVSAMPCFSA